MFRRDGVWREADFSTGRVLNLDKTYRAIIKPAAEAAGLQCIRADEIVHSGVIDVPMYQHLLNADVVVADLSTANPNAFYELGVRHALRPYSTIVIAESKLKYPFDVNHTVIRTYEHLGSGIDYEEALKVRDQITSAIRAILPKRESDSPVYVFLSGLRPPALGVSDKPLAPDAGAGLAPPHEPTVRSLLDEADAAMARKDFATAKAVLVAARAIRPQETFIVQRLALATYKAGTPSKREALEAAQAILRELKPESSNDTETLGLWGAVHKRLWEETSERTNLDVAIVAYEKGFYLRNDYYNGINLAFLLNVRAAVSEPADAITDFVLAQRVRRYVVRLSAELADDDKLSQQDQHWVLATGAEASFGLGDAAAYDEWIRRANGSGPAGWMRESTQEQIAKLATLLANSPLKYVWPQAVV